RPTYRRDIARTEPSESLVGIRLLLEETPEADARFAGTLERDPRDVLRRDRGDSPRPPRPHDRDHARRSGVEQRVSRSARRLVRASRVRRAERTARRYDCRNSENVNGNRVSARAPYFGGREETYAAMLTRSSSVSFATTGFIRSAHSPWRAPACMSNICRTM